MNKSRWLILPSFLPFLVACGGGSDCSLLGNAVCQSSDTVVNVAPTAHPGSAQSVLLDGAAVQLDGSASTDANGDPITYAWTLLSKPSRSSAVLSQATSVRPTFTPDVAGAYFFSLTVSDGKLSSATAFVTVTVSEVNAPPVANAGPDQSVLLDAVVTLDGRESSDANRDDALTFQWSLVRPDGTIQELTGVRPTFTAALKGTYTALLTVRDAVSSSASDSVRVVVSEANAPPVAVISAPSSVPVGTSVALSAAGSSDANRDTLTYKWSMQSKPLKSTGAPADSAAVLSSTTVVNPVFVADVAGVYVISLVVNDGKVNSDPISIAVVASALNLPPVANAGPEQVVAVATQVTLDGSGSIDPNGDTLSYQWTLTTKPDTSTATLANDTSVGPTFTPDLAGFYVATLTVSDGKGGSHVSRVLIRAE